MGRGGSGRAPIVGGGEKVRRRLRAPEDPAAELMPAAEFLGNETDFAAILEGFRDTPFDPARRRVLGRLMGMFAMDYQGAQPVERRFLRRLLAAGNPREGYVANRGLHLCGAPPVIRRTLALGVAEIRFARGRVVGFLGAVQARVAATTFRLLGPRGRELLWGLLTLAGHGDAGPLPDADRVIERALILKAVAARRHRLGPWSRDGETALAEISAFAVGIRGCTRQSLAARTTLIPGDPKQIAPIIAGLDDPAARAGLIARGEIDPVFAWQAHGASGERATAPAATAPAATAPDATAPAATAESQVHAADDALPDLDRSALVDRPRLHWAFAQARVRRAEIMLPGEREALSDFITGGKMHDKKVVLKDSGWRIVKDKGFDIAGEEAMQGIRLDAQGIYRFDSARALGDLLSRYTGATYVRRMFSDQITAGADPLKQIVTALIRGLAVPIVVHELKITLVKAFAAIGWQGDSAGAWQVELTEPSMGKEMHLPAKTLLLPVLPPDFGRRARAEAYMAPAALDLLTPPFGIPFPALGIEDQL